MTRRTLLAVFAVGGAAAATLFVAGCAPAPLDPACSTPEGCSQLTAAAGLNQYDMLGLIYDGTPPRDRRFAFQVLRAGQSGADFVEPDPDEFVTAPATDGTAAERSYNPAATELFTFADGDTVAFYEVFDS